MPRKSSALRLDQANSLLEKLVSSEYSQAIQFQIGFVKDMIMKLESSRAMSKKQRDWLDNMIEDGVPEPADKDLVLRIIGLTNVEGQLEKDRRVLIDFAGKVFRGWKLSEKQTAFLNALLEKAQRLRDIGPYSPDEETTSRLRLAVEIARGRADGYWFHRNGELRAFSCCDSWLKGDNKYISEYHVTVMLKSSRVGLRELDNPRHAIGSMVYCYTGVDTGDCAGIVLAGPHLENKRFRGCVSYDVLINGEVKQYVYDKIKKRRSYK